jgi:hypothetical protein
MKIKTNKTFIKLRTKMVQKCILLLENNIYVWRETFSFGKKKEKEKENFEINDPIAN